MLKYNTLGSRTTVQPPPPFPLHGTSAVGEMPPPLSTYVLQSDLLTLRERGVVPKKKGKEVFRRRSPSPPPYAPFSQLCISGTLSVNSPQEEGSRLPPPSLPLFLPPPPLPTVD